MRRAPPANHLPLCLPLFFFALLPLLPSPPASANPRTRHFTSGPLKPPGWFPLPLGAREGIGGNFDFTPFLSLGVQRGLAVPGSGPMKSLLCLRRGKKGGSCKGKKKKRNLAQSLPSRCPMASGGGAQRPIGEGQRGLGRQERGGARARASGGGANRRPRSPAQRSFCSTACYLEGDPGWPREARVGQALSPG